LFIAEVIPTTSSGKDVAVPISRKLIVYPDSLNRRAILVLEFMNMDTDLAKTKKATDSNKTFPNKLVVIQCFNKFIFHL